MKEELSDYIELGGQRPLRRWYLDVDLLSWVGMYKGTSRGPAWPRHTERGIWYEKRRENSREDFSGLGNTRLACGFYSKCSTGFYPGKLRDLIYFSFKRTYYFYVQKIQNSIYLAQFGSQFFSLCLFQLGNTSHGLFLPSDCRCHYIHHYNWSW